MQNTQVSKAEGWGYTKNALMLIDFGKADFGCVQEAAAPPTDLVQILHENALRGKAEREVAFFKSIIHRVCILMRLLLEGL